MSEQPQDFYHVTSAWALESIIHSKGIDPNRAEGKRKMAWYVKREGVSWAIAHVLYRHALYLSHVVVLRVHCTERYMHQLNYHLLWATKRVHKPTDWETARFWLEKEEKEVLVQEALMAGERWYEHLKE